MRIIPLLLCITALSTLPAQAQSISFVRSSEELSDRLRGFDSPSSEKSPIPACISLLGSPAVRREIQLSADKTKTIKSLLTEANRLDSGGLMTMEEGQYRAKQRKITPPDSLRWQAWRMLTWSQQNRLQQIQFQQNIPFLLNNESQAKSLGASPEQILQIREAQGLAYRRFQRDTASLPPLHEEMNKAYGLYEAHCAAILNDYLTTKQKERLVALQGKPFAEKITYDIPGVAYD